MRLQSRARCMMMVKMLSHGCDPLAGCIRRHDQTRWAWKTVRAACWHSVFWQRLAVISSRGFCTCGWSFDAQVLQGAMVWTSRSPVAPFILAWHALKVLLQPRSFSEPLCAATALHSRNCWCCLDRAVCGLGIGSEDQDYGQGDKQAGQMAQPYDSWDSLYATCLNLYLRPLQESHDATQ